MTDPTTATDAESSSDPVYTATRVTPEERRDASGASTATESTDEDAPVHTQTRVP